MHSIPSQAPDRNQDERVQGRHLRGLGAVAPPPQEKEKKKKMKKEKKRKEEGNYE